eukprot:jgi/Chlat1/7075/Chrsp57S06725
MGRSKAAPLLLIKVRSSDQMLIPAQAAPTSGPQLLVVYTFSCNPKHGSKPMVLQFVAFQIRRTRYPTNSMSRLSPRSPAHGRRSLDINNSVNNHKPTTIGHLPRIGKSLDIPDARWREDDTNGNGVGVGVGVGADAAEDNDFVIGDVLGVDKRDDGRPTTFDHALAAKLERRGTLQDRSLVLRHEEVPNNNTSSNENPPQGPNGNAASTAAAGPSLTRRMTFGRWYLPPSEWRSTQQVAGSSGGSGNGDNATMPASAIPLTRVFHTEKVSESGPGEPDGEQKGERSGFATIVSARDGGQAFELSCEAARTVHGAR